MRNLCDESAVDAFEFQWLAEWDATYPPRAERSPGSRREPWRESRSYDVDALADILVDSCLPIFSVHANRDVGIYLCGDDEEIEYGRRLIRDTLDLSERVGASVAVFHAWDTYSESFDPEQIRAMLTSEAQRFPDIAASVENVPTHLPSLTPASLVKKFNWITVDTRWAAMYDEFDRFSELRDKIANIHIRGHLAGDNWELPDAPISFSETISMAIQKWRYDGPLTLEPEGGIDEDSWVDFLHALNWVRSSLLDDSV